MALVIVEVVIVSVSVVPVVVDLVCEVTVGRKSICRHIAYNRMYSLL